MKNVLQTTIKISTANLLEFKGQDLTLSPRAAKDIESLIAIEAKIKDFKEQFEQALLVEMEKKNTMHIERGNIILKRKLTGHKFSFDPTSKVDAKFSKTVSYQAVDSEKVEAQLLLTGKLPKGIIQKARKYVLEIKHDTE